MTIRHEDLAAAGYPDPSLDVETTRAYENSLRRKRDAVAGAIRYLRREWPSVVRRIEKEAGDAVLVTATMYHGECHCADDSCLCPCHEGAS